MNNHLPGKRDLRSIFPLVARLLPEVAPLKVTMPVSLDTSLSRDLDFDSLDIVALLAGIDLHFSIEVDFEEWLFQESQREDSPHTVESLCELIMRSLRETDDAFASDRCLTTSCTGPGQ